MSWNLNSLKSGFLLLHTYYHTLSLKIHVVYWQIKASLEEFCLQKYISCFQNWFLYIYSSIVLPPLLVLQEEQPENKTCDIEPLLSPDITPVHTQSLAHPITAATNGGELLELRLDSISTISSWKILHYTLKILWKLWIPSTNDECLQKSPFSAEHQYLNRSSWK